MLAQIILGDFFDSQSAIGNACVSRVNKVWSVINNAHICIHSQYVTKSLQIILLDWFNGTSYLSKGYRFGQHPLVLFSLCYYLKEQQHKFVWRDAHKVLFFIYLCSTVFYQNGLESFISVWIFSQRIAHCKFIFCLGKRIVHTHMHAAETLPVVCFLANFISFYTL